MDLTASPLPKRNRGPGFAVMLLLLLAVLSVFLYGVYLPGHTFFSNDGPLARLMSDSHKLPQRFTGCWQDLNAAGYREPGALPNISFGLQYLLKPVGFSKFYVICALTILGLGAWCFFRQSGLSPAACILGGLAAAFNSCFFSDACWGVAGHAIAIGMTFFAMAALSNMSSPWRWLRVILAGLTVGMAVSEGSDIGAIFSICVAAYVIYSAWIAPGPHVRNLSLGAGRVALIVVCSALVSAQAVSELVSTNVIDVTTPNASAPANTRRWDWATQWSLPKRETLSLIVPGLFGYHIDTPDGGNYWGTIGRDAAWLQYDERGRTGPAPTGVFTRYVGNGFYAGVTAVLIAVWAALQALYRKNSVFNLTERKWLWFWLFVGFASLLIAYGRYAPFYRIVYVLPYVSKVRNPDKFLDVVSFSIVILFAYGTDGLWRRYFRPLGAQASSRWTGFSHWWKTGSDADKAWLRGCALVLILGMVAWMIYALSFDSLRDYLHTVEFGMDVAAKIAAFSIRQVGWFVLFFFLASVYLALVFSGCFTGVRARWGAVALGALLVADLGRANLPWIIFWDYQTKYASNPVVDSFRDQPWEHRVAQIPVRPPPEYVLLDRVYRLNWLQQLFPYYNIQSLDLVQMSRMPDDMADFNATFKPVNPEDIPRLFRLWQLTDTRYLLGATKVEDYLDKYSAEYSGSLHVVSRFDLVTQPGATVNIADVTTAVPDTNGDYAVFEFPAALPRAKLYSNWQVNTNGTDTLETLVDPAFDPVHTVLVSGNVEPPSAAVVSNQNPGTVQIVSYAPKDVLLKSGAPGPTVLLLNDRIDPDWRVTVDGAPRSVLRCNFMMRGVYLDPGTHTIEFKYRPSYRALYVSLAALGVGVVLLGVLLIVEGRAPLPVSAPVMPAAAAPRPAPTPAQDNSAPASAGSKNASPAPSGQKRSKRSAARAKR